MRSKYVKLKSGRGVPEFSNSVDISTKEKFESTINPKNSMEKSASQNFSEKDSRVLAWKESSEIRKFEIEMYWKRAAYFWAFIVSIYTAFFSILCAEAKEGSFLESIDGLGEILALTLAFLGFVFCLGFLLQNIGSKEWQKNWEVHMDLLEDRVTGPLYKIFIQDERKNYSVTKINEALCKILVVASVLILIFAAVLAVDRKIIKVVLGKSCVKYFTTLAVLASAAVFSLRALCTSWLKGNKTGGKGEDTKFVERIYE